MKCLKHACCITAYWCDAPDDVERALVVEK